MTHASTDLFLEGFTPTVKLLPVVYLSVLDHYQRRSEGQPRVIGTLLGTVVGTQVQVTSCFPVPHSETDETVAVDMDYHRTMSELHQRVNPKEVIVGWYATGNEVTEHSTLIHEFYSRDTKNPVHICIDTKLSGGRMSVLAVVSAPMGVPKTGEAVGTLFTPVKCEVELHEPERIALDLMQRGLGREKAGTTSFITDLEQVFESTAKLQDMLGMVIEYVNKVVAGEIKGDPQVGKFLLDTLAAVPKLDPAQVEQLFKTTLQDLLLVVYLSNITRQQVMLQEKLSDVL
eukprot:m.48959 g.48959  ORF g.48959 m.48959 type:complete len:287 (-) comp12036_c0_seq2:49-909(-)